MKKKFLLSLAAVVAIAVGVVGMSAFEAHVINVTAQIENALSVIPDEISFGTVFPQEQLDREVEIAMSESFFKEGAADDIDYVIKQKPKCMRIAEASQDLPLYGRVVEVGDGDEFECADEVNYDMMPFLCPYLSKHDLDPEDGNDDSLDAFHGPIEVGPSGWTNFTTTKLGVDGRLAKSEDDLTDLWNIDLKVPCFEGECAQDWAAYVTNINPDVTDPYAYVQPQANKSEQFGCDLWIEVTNIRRTDDFVEFFTADLENKDVQNDWSAITDDNIYGTLTYSSVEGSNQLDGKVEAFNLVPNRKYQITLNGPGPCTATDELLALAGANNFESGYWNGGPNLESTCGTPGEGAYNMGVTDGTTNYFTVETDSNGDFVYDFSITALAPGTYDGVKVIVKLLMEPWQSPWVDETDVTHSNLFETAPISFEIN